MMAGAVLKDNTLNQKTQGRKKRSDRRECEKSYEGRCLFDDIISTDEKLKTYV